MTDEPVSGHILDFCIPEDDIGDGGLLDFIDNLRGVGRFEPKSICVSDAGELQTCNGGPKFSKH